MNCLELRTIIYNIVAWFDIANCVDKTVLIGEKLKLYKEEVIYKFIKSIKNDFEYSIIKKVLKIIRIYAQNSVVVNIYIYCNKK